jgi:pimeloyl-ACP methyl ester carboxylesterase
MVSNERAQRAPFAAPAGFTRGDVDTGSVRLTYWRHGQGRPLLVLHGRSDWGLDWARFARRVGGDVDCVLLDQRGHGYSDKPYDGYTHARMAEDAAAVVRRLGLERPAVLGHSMGGGAALALAAGLQDEIDRLLLVDPSVRVLDQDARDGRDRGGSDPRSAAQQGREALKLRQALGRQALIEQLRHAHPTWDDEDVANTVESTLLCSPFVFTDARRPDAAAQRAQLASLRCPTLVVRGEPERGSLISDEAARLIPGLVPDGRARVTTIAGTGHVPQRQAFDLFVAVVLPFLTGEAAPAAEGGSPACLLHLLPEDY